MWINKRLPMLRRHPVCGVLASIGFIATTVILKLIFPSLPPFLPLYPVVLLSAFVGGRCGGVLAWAVCTVLAAYYFQGTQAGSYPGIWGPLTVIGFSSVCALTVFIVGLLDRAVDRLEHERNRLELALKAANLATWELHPDGRLHWDRNFFEMVGLDPESEPPSTERFLAMIHPDDRLRMSETRKLMQKGAQPVHKDEYRLTRPDGRMIWLENYRASVRGEGAHFIGITQDITGRKRNERRINLLMREVAHRVKNQYAVIMAMVRETSKQARSPREFESLIQARISALSRSHDLLIHGEWEVADLKGLLIAHVDVFGAIDRLDADGPAVSLTAMSAQYLGMAFHELCTNAAKHGAFAVPGGRVKVRWALEGEATKETFAFTWQEIGGPKPRKSKRQGFGSKVLNRLAPNALSGCAEIELPETGLVWRVKAPLNFIRNTDHMPVDA